MAATERPVYTFQPGEGDPKCFVCGVSEPHIHHLEEADTLYRKGQSIRAIYLHRQITGSGISAAMIDLAESYTKSESEDYES